MVHDWRYEFGFGSTAKFSFWIIDSIDDLLNKILGLIKEKKEGYVCNCNYLIKFHNLLFSNKKNIYDLFILFWIKF